MKKTIYSILISILILSFSNSNAQDNSRQSQLVKNKNITNNLEEIIPKGISSKIDIFFNLIFKKEYKQAFEKLLSNSPIIQKDIEHKNILEQLKRSIELYGEVKDYELASYAVVGKSYYRVYAIGLHDKYPTRWEFTFYNSPTLGLIISNFRFDDMTEAMFD